MFFKYVLHMKFNGAVRYKLESVASSHRHPCFPDYVRSLATCSFITRSVSAPNSSMGQSSETEQVMSGMASPQEREYLVPGRV